MTQPLIKKVPFLPNVVRPPLLYCWTLALIYIFFTDWFIFLQILFRVYNLSCNLRSHNCLRTVGLQLEPLLFCTIWSLHPNSHDTHPEESLKRYPFFTTKLSAANSWWAVWSQGEFLMSQAFLSNGQLQSPQTTMEWSEPRYKFHSRIGLTYLRTKSHSFNTVV